MTIEKLVSYKNTKGRTLLHQAAYFGYYKIVADLLTYFNLDEKLNIYEKDDRGYTAFELACIQGYKIDNDQTVQSSDGSLISKRFLICELFFRLKNTEGNNKFQLSIDRLKQGTNNPLHWAIFRQDLQLANLIFRRNPLLLFMLNDKGQLPLDLCFKHEEKFYSESSLLILKQLVAKAYDLLKETETLKNISNFFQKDQVRINPNPKKNLTTDKTTTKSTLKTYQNNHPSEKDKNKPSSKNVKFSEIIEDIKDQVKDKKISTHSFKRSKTVDINRYEFDQEKNIENPQQFSFIANQGGIT